MPMNAIRLNKAPIAVLSRQDLLRNDTKIYLIWLGAWRLGNSSGYSFRSCVINVAYDGLWTVDVFNHGT